MSPTARALVQRGLNTQLAEALHRDGYTLAKLRTLPRQALDELGILRSCQEAIIDGRPPIPQGTLHELLYKSRNTCCVCHDRSRGVVVHHIVPWAKSRNHDINNLVVLCSLCHDKAHTTKELTRELTPQQLRHHKKEWLAESQRARTSALFSPRSFSINAGFWDYFNRQRLVDCASSSQIDLESLPGYDDFVATDGQGLDLPFRVASKPRRGGDDDCSFLASLLRAVCERHDWIDLAGIWSRTQIRSMLIPNMLIALTSNHRFKPAGGPACGPGQSCTGYYTRQGIRMEFTFDLWDCTSSSSYSHHLRGQWICTSLGFVRSVSHSGGKLLIQSTCLAIGTGFTEYSGGTPAVAYTHGDAGDDWEESVNDETIHQESPA